jgi:transposase
MNKLEQLGREQLRAALDDAATAKAAKRLMVALAYKDGVHVETLSDRYGIPQSTIYYWLDRFETQPIGDAVEDETRPGRPPKLSDEQRAEVESWLTSPPESDDEPTEWTGARLQQRISEEFGVEYSVAHVSRTFLQ